MSKMTAQEDTTRKRLLTSVNNRENLSPKVRRCAASVIRNMSSRLCEDRNRNSLGARPSYIQSDWRIHPFDLFIANSIRY